MQIFFFQFHIVSYNIPFCVLSASMDPKYFTSENGSGVAPQNLSILQENEILFSQNPAHNTNLLNSNPPIMHADHQKGQKNWLLANLQKNPSWPAPSFTALLSMDYSLVLGAELAAERNPTDLFQFLTPIEAPEMPEIQSSLTINTNNLPPLQPPDFRASPVTTQPIPQAPTNRHVSLVHGSLDSTLQGTSIDLTHTTEASLHHVTLDPSRRVYPCTVCGATFYNAQALGGHMSYHSKEKRKKQPK